MRTTPPVRVSSVQAEVFVLRLCGAHAELAGPYGPDPWYIDVYPDDDPVEVVGEQTRTLIGEPLLVHSTSWRRARGSLILSFVVIQGEGQAPQMRGLPVARTILARSVATHAPCEIDAEQVLEHGLRHLAWLARDDATVRSLLCERWRRVLADYVPQPFRTFG